MIIFVIVRSNKSSCEKKKLKVRCAVNVFAAQNRRDKLKSFNQNRLPVDPTVYNKVARNIRIGNLVPGNMTLQEIIRKLFEYFFSRIY